MYLRLHNAAGQATRITVDDRLRAYRNAYRMAERRLGNLAGPVQDGRGNEYALIVEGTYAVQFAPLGNAMTTNPQGDDNENPPE